MFQNFRGDTAVHRVVQHQQHAVGALHLLACAAHTFSLDLVARFAQAGGVHDMQRHAIDMNSFTQHIAGGAGDGADDRRRRLGEGVEQARLAGVGPTGEHDRHAVME